MKKTMKVLGVWCLVLGAGVADACMGMYAGKKVTADGSVLIGRTVDFSPHNATMVQQICERDTAIAERYSRAARFDR